MPRPTRSRPSGQGSPPRAGGLRPSPPSRRTACGVAARTSRSGSRRRPRSSCSGSSASTRTSPQARHALELVRANAKWEHEGAELLPWRGRALHQRPGAGHRRLFRPGRPRHRRSAPDGADGGRRLELRAGAWIDARFVRDHDQRPGRVPRVRAIDRRRLRRGGCPRPRPGISSRAAPPAPPLDW